MKNPKVKKPAPVRKRKVNKLAVAFIVYVILAVAGGFFLAWAVKQPAPEVDQYADYRRLYEEIIAYDYSNGRNHTIEERLDKASENENINPVRSYYNLKAKGYYYSQFQLYFTAIEAYESALDIAPTEDEIDEVAGALYNVYTAVGDTEKASLYEFTQGCN